MIHEAEGTADNRQWAVNKTIKAFRQIGEKILFSFAKWKTVSPMAQMAIDSASLAYAL